MLPTFDTCQELVAWVDEARATRRADAAARWFGPIDPHYHLAPAPDPRAVLWEVPGVAEADRIAAWGDQVALAHGSAVVFVGPGGGSVRREFSDPVVGLVRHGPALVVLTSGRGTVTSTTLIGADQATVREIRVDGELLAARSIAAGVVLVTRNANVRSSLDDLLPQIQVDGGFISSSCADVAAAPGYGPLARTTVVRFDPRSGTPRSTSVLGPVDLTTVTPDAVWIGQVGRRSLGTTLAHRLDLASGRFAVSGEIPGRILSSSAWSESDGVLRAVHTDAGRLGARVSTHQIAPGTPQIATTPLLAPGETLTAARFDGHLAWASTVVVRKDPLFAVDVRDPARPTVLAALDVPGVTRDLLVIDGGARLLALGEDLVEGRLAPVVTLFDTRDPASTRLIARVALAGSTSAALHDRLAMGWDPAAGVLAVPTNGGGQAGVQWMRVYADMLEVDGFVPTGPRPDRAAYLAGRWWISSGGDWTSLPAATGGTVSEAAP